MTTDIGIGHYEKKISTGQHYRWGHEGEASRDGAREEVAGVGMSHCPGRVCVRVVQKSVIKTAAAAKKYVRPG
jgi:hypothetical protein